MKMIKGNTVELRSANLADRRMVWEWSEHSDVAHLLLSPDQDGPNPFDQWCAGWKEYYFADESPELGRGFIVLFDGNPVGFIAYNDIDPKNRVELDIWMNSEANCGKGFGPDAIKTLCAHLTAEFGVNTFMMQPSARNPRAIRAYQKAGFVRTPATPEQIRAEWGGVDAEDSVLMIRKEDHTTGASTTTDHPALRTG
ncbi:GNAT family N-acetyltransferase [Verrucomicrobiota bacterium]